MPGAAPVLAVDDNPPAEGDRHEQLAAAVAVEVEAAVGAAEPGEERQMRDATRSVPREEVMRVGLSRRMRFVCRGSRAARQQKYRSRERGRTAEHGVARGFHDRGRYTGGAPLRTILALEPPTLRRLTPFGVGGGHLMAR